MKKISLLFTSLSVLVGLSVITSHSGSPQKPIILQPAVISMIQLIATPEKLDGKMISVVGFLAIGTEDARLYFSQEDYRHVIMDNGVWVDVNKEISRNMEKVDLHYVAIVGVFKQKGLPPHFPGGTGDGGITDIRRCTPLLEFTETRPRKLKETQPEKPR